MAWVRGWLVLILMSCACLTASAQQAGRRVALVIGNSAYVTQGTLANPGPDSRLVADALRRVGFSVTALLDQGKPGMERALRDFSRQADGAEVALVYYAGHGMEANGVNWLLPVDATLADERDLSFEAINLDTVLATVDGARGLRMVVLDACRNNPFTRSMRRGASTTRAVTRGLADVEVTGTLVLYSARGGSLAQDGPAGGNSPFAIALARRIPEPGVDIRVLVGKVRDDVLAATRRGQEPFSYGSLPGVELVMVAAVQAPRLDPNVERDLRARIAELEKMQRASPAPMTQAATSPATPAPRPPAAVTTTPTAPAPQSQDDQLWTLASNRRSIYSVEDYLARAASRQIPGAHVDEARARLATLRQERTTFLAQPLTEAFQLTRKPTYRDVSRYYPARALEREMSGSVGLICRIEADGTLVCVVETEEPAGWGFGDAAIYIVKTMRVAPTLTSGGSSAGSYIRLRFPFSLGG